MVTANTTLGGGGFEGGKNISMEQLADQLIEELDLAKFLGQVVNSLKVELTPAAYLMLLVPLAEINRQARLGTSRWRFSLQRGLVIERPLVEESLRKLLTEIARSPATSDRNIKREHTGLLFRKALPLRSSLSVIKAYWARFCNIPPLCGETEE